MKDEHRVEQAFSGSGAAASWTGRLADTGETVEVRASGGRIVEVRSVGEAAGSVGRAASGDERPTLPWISPGWIDLQVNGYGGFDLNGDRTLPEDVAGLTAALYRHGVTSYLPTVITGSFERIRQAMSRPRLRGRCPNWPFGGRHSSGRA